MNHNRDRRLARQARNAPPKEQAIPITSPYITLGQFLKHANVLSTGGEVRSFLESVAITVNGEAEQRRGRKLYPGDLIAIEQNLLRIVVAEDNAEESEA